MSGLYGVVMAGGSGQRFWPASRAHHPKQLLSIGGDQPLIVEALRRLEPVTGPVSEGRQYVVAGSQHQASILELCEGLKPERLLIEPCARNTLPCVALAALHIEHRDPEAVIVISPADHHVAYPRAFTLALERAAERAARGALVTLGVSPTRPETGYGYIERAELAEGQPRGQEPRSCVGGGAVGAAHRVARFVEKPSREVAERYLESGQFLWNSGLFVMSVKALFKEIKRQLPDHWEAFERLKASLGTPRYHETLSAEFSALRSVSLDYGVMEGAEAVEVIPVELGWSDVGHWAALRELYPRDEGGNIAVGCPYQLLDARDNVLYSSSERALQVSMIGVSGLVVAQSPDALLICPVEQSQRVRELVEELKRRGDDHLI